MKNEKLITVPDIGNFDHVEVIDILIKVGDEIKKDDSLITVESDKASMDIPSSEAGIIEDILVKVGDKVSKGHQIARIKSIDADLEKNETKAIKENIDQKTKTTDNANNKDLYDLVVLGSGPGGYTAAFRAADLGLKVALVEKHASIGGVCLNVGCIPSKALLHIAKVITEAEESAQHGVEFSKPKIDLEKIRNWKNNEVVSKLTQGLSSMSAQRKVTIIQGYGKFVDANNILIEGADGSKINLNFTSAIIAVGSKPIEIPNTPQHENIIDSTGVSILELTLTIQGVGLLMTACMLTLKSEAHNHHPDAPLSSIVRGL
jgi:dihydrolipoamide dehydrogenase